jgi:cellulose synthase operon protein YhjQ
LSDPRKPESNSSARDVRALFDKARLGTAGYRTFAAAKPPVQPKTTADAKDLGASEKAPVPATTNEALSAVPAYESRRMLHSLFEVNSRLRVDSFRPRLSMGSGAAVAFASCAGGVGKTTLCATIARVSSTRFASVLVADRCLDGIIPYYFGLDRQSAGGLQTVYPNARRAGYQMTLVAAPSEAQPNPAIATWLEQLQTESVLTLLDLPTFSAPPANAALKGVSQIVVPLVPDVQSIASIARAEELAGRLEDGHETHGRALFVLNRFDESKPLHREIRTHLEKLLEGRLAPVAIRESEFVPEALSLGLTVLDHLPQSQVAKDFEQFAGWLEEHLASAVDVSTEKVEIA